MSDNRYPGVGIIIALLAGALMWGSFFWILSSKIH